MPRPKSPVPKLTHHKAGNRGVVRLNGHDHYVGPYPLHLTDPPPETRAVYGKLLCEWLANRRRLLCPNGSTQEKAGVGEHQPPEAA
jgi:hypothetical protein